MFRLLRFFISLTVLAVIVYVAIFVPLGSKTLWQHLKAIADTKESQELVEGVKKKATGALSRSDAGPAEGKQKGGDSDRLTAQERKLLRKLIKQKLSSDNVAE